MTTIEIITWLTLSIAAGCAAYEVVCFIMKRRRIAAGYDPDAYVNSMYDEDLAERFTDDYKFPMSVTRDKDVFIYQLILYEKGYGTWTKWMEVYHEICEHYDGNPAKFLQRYYDDRNKIITTLEASYAYQVFVSDKEFAKKFEIPKNEVPKARWSKNLYNGEADGKMFFSVDLNKANFQSLRYYDRQLVQDAATYEEFIGKFSDMEYLRDSKYSRQVIFGKLNAPRQITIEQYLLHIVWQNYKQIPGLKTCYMDEALATRSNDEFVVEVDDGFTPEMGETIIRDIYAETHIDIKYELFTLKALKLISDKSGHSRAMFFIKDVIAPVRKQKLVTVPNPYFPIVWKLYHGAPLCAFDRHFVYEKIDCLFNETFHLEDQDGNIWTPPLPEKKKKKNWMFGPIYPFSCL